MKREAYVSSTLVIKVVCFSIIDDRLKIFLTNDTLPVSPLQSAITLDETVKQLFESTTHIPLATHYWEQLYTVTSSSGEIAIVYYVLVPPSIIKNSNMWLPFSNMQKYMIDYSIISYAIQRLQWKIEYTNVVYSLLPEEFTLSELQKTYEAILGKPLDKRNFRKKIRSLRFLKSTGRKRMGIARPAETYQFLKRKPVIVNIFG